MTEITHHTGYRQTLAVVKQRIQTSQIRAELAVVDAVVPLPVEQLLWELDR